MKANILISVPSKLYINLTIKPWISQVKKVIKIFSLHLTLTGLWLQHLF